ncbi:YlbL family protein [Nocardioides pantholopis]|uniref:YlbL family protein n=1 Tax=Nocardioides pantholopis TaxID=2483798 RepID=UPI000F0924F4|nr:S16 family serine protease [Nocardioides pantholopis]
MTQRTIAALVAVPLLLALFAVAVFTPLPYATYAPGLTVDVLGTTEDDGKGSGDGETETEETGEVEIIQVDGHEVYRDEGQLRMTTVFVSLPGAEKTLPELIGAWFDEDRAVYPYDAVHDEDETVEESRRTGAIDMVSSQDQAVAVALEELGYQVTPAVMAAYIEKDTPAQGVLEVGDLFLRVNGTAVSTPDQMAELVAATPEGDPVEIDLLRDGEKRTVMLLPEQVDGQARVGVTLGTGYRFPFEVSVNIDAQIGGPSAGLMFSLAIYDALTPGALTGGKSVAGTGTISADGEVGPIGGIQQKIAGARRDGADLFLVPEDNCADALGAEAGDMRLVRATTMHEARLAIEAYAEDPDAKLPSCED